MEKQLRLKTQRLWDLVRYQRSELFAADLISRDEYAELVQDHGAVERLETYDSMRQKLAAKDALLERARTFAQKEHDKHFCVCHLRHHGVSTCTKCEAKALITELEGK
jgi:hypothetical protein